MGDEYMGLVWGMSEPGEIGSKGVYTAKGWVKGQKLHKAWNCYATTSKK